MRFIGASEADPNGKYGAGSVYLYSGVDGAVLWQLDGDSAYDGLGTSVAGTGDINGDGIPDVIIGAPMSFLGRHSAGFARVCSGADGTTLLRFEGAEDQDHLGFAVAAAGDINRDKVTDRGP